MDNNYKNKHYFKLKYDKKSHSLSTETYATTLVSISTLLKEINNKINPAGNDISINVVTEKSGSFDIHIEIAKFLTDNQATIAATIQSLPTLVNTLLQIILLKIQLKNVKPEEQKVELNGNNAIIKNSDNITICQTNTTVYNLYAKDQTINDAISNHFKAVDKDKDIKAAVFTNQGKSTTIQKKDFSALAKKRVVNNNEAATVDYSATLIISKLNLDNPKSKWGFIYNGTNINARINDDSFWQKILSGEEHFARGDRLSCNIEIVKEYEPELGAYLNREYTIIEVIDHIEQPTKTELDM